MTGQMIASRYAQALFALCKREGLQVLESVSGQLNELADTLQGAPELYRLFRNPAFSAEEKKKVLDALMAKGEFTAAVINFCHLLADRERLSFLPEVAADFQVHLDAEKGIKRGQVVTAIAMPDTERAKITSRLEEGLKQGLVLDFKEDEQVLGGLVLKVGDKLYDASLRTQLDILKENFKRGE